MIRNSILLDQKLALQRVSNLYGGRLEALQEAWALRIPLKENGNTAEPHLSTLYHWFEGKIPGSIDTLFQLAAMLNLDPVALFHITSETLPDIVDQLVQDFLKNRSRRALGFFNAFFHANPQWPPGDPVRYFDPPRWYCEDILHDPDEERDIYAAFSLSRTGGEDLRTVYYFAYRRALPGVTAWIPYGLIIRCKQETFLVHSSGYTQHVPAEEPQAPTIVETWFGRGAAEFRIACVHKFEMQRVTTPFQNMPVRFLA